MLQTLVGVITLFTVTAISQVPVHAQLPLAVVSYSLSNRYKDPTVNEIFSDNILLTLAYMNGNIKKGEPVSWDKIRDKQTYSLVLNPGETFAFHEAVSDKYKNKIAKTTNAHFNWSEGFKSDGWLVGDGVCHLASFMYVAAKEAGLTVEAPTRHDFATISEVAKEDGVSIYFSPTDTGRSIAQNLYITNTREKAISFVFSYKNNDLSIQVKE